MALGEGDGLGLQPLHMARTAVRGIPCLMRRWTRSSRTVLSCKPAVLPRLLPICRGASFWFAPFVVSRRRGGGLPCRSACRSAAGGALVWLVQGGEPTPYSLPGSRSWLASETLPGVDPRRDCAGGLYGHREKRRMPGFARLR